IPELSRRSDGPCFCRIKPTGLAEVHSKFRPVKRVSPLKHQPENTDSDSDGKAENQGLVLGEPAEGGKDDPGSDKPSNAPNPSSDGPKPKGLGGGGGNPQALFGELEHYDLDMDEILDVPYIKSSQQMSTLPRVPHDKRSTPVRNLEVKSKSMDPDLHHLHRSPGGGGYPPEMLSSSLLSCSSSLSSFSDAGRNSENTKTLFYSRLLSYLLLLLLLLLLQPHLAADNLELIRDEDGNNLLHVSASQGHADCLQHLTSLMGEDGLNERNTQQLTPAGLGVKNGHLECVRWMVSETEAIAELSCTREHPSLIHYAARYGQEKVLLWLLQFMQEQAISLDEVDQNGNTAVHVAAQYGHLTCIQTLVEYGSNVTVQNQQGERPSQSAERQGHTTCARYLVVVETCMSLASQVVKLTKQLNEQAAERMTLQKQIQRLMDPNKTEGTPNRSPSLCSFCMMLTAEGTPGDGHWLVRQGGVGPDSVLRQLLGKDSTEPLCPRERLPPAGSLSRDVPPGGRRTGLVERRELKLARLKQIMQRSLSESDSDGYPPEEGKSHGAPPPGTLRPDRPSNLPIAEEEPASNHLQLMMRKHLPSSDRKLAFSLSGSKSVDAVGFNPSPTSSDPEAADGKTPDTDDGQKAATSPKSALKSPSSRRKTSQNLKLRVTFDEQVHRSSTQEAEPARAKDRTATGSSESKRPFGTFRSIMETLSGNSNHNNNSSSSSQVSSKPSGHNSPGRKSDSKSSPGGGAKGKSKSSNV
uniref:Synuclein, alpha interacting protein n=1 Tax=Acanthochromis polyacanthus TaxID=80966 RepID=A0A3Q1EYE2_9TELE